MGARTSWIGPLLLWLGLANLGCALVVYLTSSAMAGLSYTVVTSTYRELDTNGVIDHSKLSELWGARYADNWHNVVRRLVDEPLGGLYRTSYLPTGLLLLNGAILIVLWWRVRRGDMNAAVETKKGPGVSG